MAQKRRKEQMIKQQQRRSTLLCALGGLGAILLSLTICLIVFDIKPPAQPVSAPASTALPYDADSPFSIADLTSKQLTQIREDRRISVSDGPRGVSIGDPLEKIFEHFPTDYLGEQPEDAQILYCAEYFENQNGLMTVLPPRGLLTEENGFLVVTLLAPTGAYPEGTHDSYGSYEHVYCVFTIEPDTMTVSEIILGIDH